MSNVLGICLDLDIEEGFCCIFGRLERRRKMPFEDSLRRLDVLKLQRRGRVVGVGIVVMDAFLETRPYFN